jgi:hypothetical protein
LWGILSDVKPSNILVDAAGSPLVADFGLAKRVDADRSLTESGAIVGTPRYMAPEQAAGRKDLTVAVDVYSLGVVLYERLTGQKPFSGETILEVLRQAREQEPPRPSSVCPGLDRDLETICLKCLEKDPSKRYASAEALQDDLDRWLRGEPIAARPVGQAERLWRWCRRNPAVASLSAGMVLALLTGTIVSVAFGLRAEERREQAEEAEGRAVAARDEQEGALARSLVWPLDPKGDLPLSEIENQALWELAERPGEHLWLRFVEEATRTPLTTSQLQGRAQPALIAAVGLDPEKRRRVERVLADRLEDTSLSGEHLLHLGMVLVELGDLEDDTVRRLSERFPQMRGSRYTVIGYQNKPSTVLAGIVTRLEPAEAARLLSLALETDADHLGQDSLRDMTERLEPAAAARLLSLALEKQTGASGLRVLADGSVTVANRLSSAKPAEAARVLFRALEKQTNAQSLGHLAEYLAVKADGLEPAAAALLCEKAAGVLSLALSKETDGYADRT